MIDAATFASRRAALTARVPGPILLVGNGTRPRNLPMNELPFRQDSTFLYFTGCDLPDAAALLDGDRFTLFLPEPGEDDALWHGPVPSLPELGERYGADVVHAASELEERAGGLDACTLAVADRNRTRLAARLTGRSLTFGSEHGDDALVDAVITLRRTKSNAEIAQLVEAGRISALAHVAAMRHTHAGSTEQGLVAIFEAVLALHHCVPGYDTILSQDGEILHNHSHDNVLEDGRLVLLDGGGELPTAYGVDITRTWPVSGAFTDRQRAAYTAVLEAQEASIALCTPGTEYRRVHDASCLVLARYLADEGLIRCSPEVAVETGAHALFFPHGVGHHLGLDVHDLENFGDRPSYPPGVDRPEAFGTRNLRLDLPVETGWVVTVEPGFYVVPTILHDPVLRERFADEVDFDRAEGWIGFGGIRIEDDVHITPHGPEVLTPGVPKAIDAVEAVVGSGSTPEELLCGS